MEGSDWKRGSGIEVVQVLLWGEDTRRVAIDNNWMS